jgi:hypothetical protein
MDYLKSYKQIIIHILIWVGLIVNFYLFNAIECEKKIMIIFALTFTLSFALSYYFVYFFIFSLAINGKYVHTIIGFIISFLIFLGVELINFKIIYPFFDIQTPRDDFKFLMFSSRSFSWYVYVFIIAYANLLIRLGIQSAIKFNERAESKIVVELDMLKNQFHSHLTLNFLNFCYTKILKFSFFTADAVEYYSDMLQYTLHANESKKININFEKEYIDNFMQLQARLTDVIFNYFDFEIDNEEYTISPLLLGIIVEHAYRNGQLDNSEKPILIQLSILKSKLIFNVSYSKAIKHRTHHHGNEMFNQLEKYLMNHYQNNYTLNYNFQGDDCFTQLILNVDGEI